MLKALEVSGFKSFAEKTRFEFPAGITVVVGPNGSGKSNIVDAIKWVLGEQSAKSLRGKDMSDVIFKGSGGPSGRRPANAAQATIVLENQNRVFEYDADEVHVSRRVYRSGETEYLINGKTSRLKDIRSLFRGTGVGTDAYSLIEQGKVERLLQTNAKDRRAIFEEAAGISRFKAKKVEAERRLARVEANLIRLSDIVEEVGSRYRSVKAQASKAARYKEHSERLQELRTFVGMKDWREYAEKLESSQAKDKTLKGEIEVLEKTTLSQSEELKAIETQYNDSAAKVQAQQDASAETREKIARTKSQLELNESRIADFAARSPQYKAQHKAAEEKAKLLTSRIEKSTKELEEAELKFSDVSSSLKSYESELTTLDQSLSSFQDQNQSRRQQYTTLMQVLGEIGKLISSSESQIESYSALQEKSAGEVARLEGAQKQSEDELKQIASETEGLRKEEEKRDGALKSAREKFEKLKDQVEARKERLGELTNQLSGMSQRSEVIEELEDSLAGVNAGAQELLKQSKTSSAGHLNEIVGLVADLVSVNVQHAGIVDVALGDKAQYLVVDGRKMIDLLADEKLKVHGRVGLIQLDDPTSLGADPAVNLSGSDGVIGRADRLVQVDKKYVAFIEKMLGGTWVVKRLQQALKLQAGAGKNSRFVTLDGEIVEADGTVVVGPKTGSVGIVSRRSELRALKRALVKLEEEIKEVREETADLTKSRDEADQQVQSMIGENTELARKLSDFKSQSLMIEKQLKQTRSRLAASQAENESAVAQLTAANAKIESDRGQLSSQELQIASITQLISSDESSAKDAQKKRAETERKSTAAKVQLAKWEQQLDDLAHRQAQASDEKREQELLLVQIASQIQADSEAEKVANEAIETAQKTLGDLKQENAAASDAIEGLLKERTEIDTKRREMNLELTAKRDALRLAQDKAHQVKLQIDQLTMQQQQLADRLEEDYGIEISAADIELSLTAEDQLQRDSIDSEIADLRKKIGHIGAVNLDALSELEDLESRYLKMDGQYQDLVQAKETLEKIIIRINADSRKLFVETLEAIRQNFQKLFRQTFGGGQADIVLEEGVDPLEAGVEIIATPPGKPQFNNSLLSGGEKALTAVSLLMAIFQFRPSPFCVLDEVDAPFDEANIGRFIDVLKSFLGWTKFVIVTHSKKTMTAATTLYGITMQESGVSKRVSVRFEDVSEDGEISDEALKRSENEDAA